MKLGNERDDEVPGGSEEHMKRRKWFEQRVSRVQIAQGGQTHPTRTMTSSTNPVRDTSRQFSLVRKELIYCRPEFRSCDL